jgi:Transposase DDE domain
VALFNGKAKDTPEHFSDEMKRAIDSPEGREKYGRLFASVAPAFGNLRYNKRLSRFTLRGRKKVHAQWKLYCLVHNEVCVQRLCEVAAVRGGRYPWMNRST